MYNFVVIDLRKGAENPELGFGIEVTIPSFLSEGVINLDHHGPDATTATLAAIEQALTCELPADGSAIGTIRADADSVGAMAVIANRAAGLSVDNQLVAAIGAVDRFGPQAIGGYEGLKDLTVAVACKIADFKLPLSERVAWVGKVLAGSYDSAEISNLVAARDEDFAAAEKASHVELVANGRIAVVVSTHRFATELGYQKAQIVVAKNPTMSVNFRDSSQGAYLKYTVCRYNEFVSVDMKRAAAELNELEASRSSDDLTWGGQSNIVGSPQGRNSTLTLEEVVAIVVKHLL